MAKFYGNVGYIITEETEPGIWTPKEVVKTYYGDVLKISRRWQNGESINDDVVYSNRISIVADTFAFEHCQYIRWVEWLKQKWAVSEVEIEYPRVTLSLGGVYNG